MVIGAGGQGRGWGWGAGGRRRWRSLTARWAFGGCLASGAFPRNWLSVVGRVPAPSLPSPPVFSPVPRSRVWRCRTSWFLQHGSLRPGYALNLKTYPGNCWRRAVHRPPLSAGQGRMEGYLGCLGAHRGTLAPPGPSRKWVGRLEEDSGERGCVVQREGGRAALAAVVRWVWVSVGRRNWKSW